MADDEDDDGGSDVKGANAMGCAHDAVMDMQDDGDAVVVAGVVVVLVAAAMGHGVTEDQH